jgi:LacI family transcriptional regulator
MDALCLVNCGPAKTRARNIEYVKSLGRPVVLLQETLEVADEEVAVINQDDFSGGSMIAEHVLSRGAKRLLMLVPSMEWPAIEERRRGIESAVGERGKGTSLEVLECPDEGFPQTQLALRNYMREHGAPDAILGGNDRLGIAALALLQEEGQRVPEDIRVTGFNGFESHRYTNPTLTTVISPASEMGQFAAASVIRRLQIGKFANNKTLYPVRFQQGGSA